MTALHLLARRALPALALLFVLGPEPPVRAQEGDDEAPLVGGIEATRNPEKEAKQWAQKAKETPDNPTFQYNLAMSLLQLRKYGEAIEPLRRYVELKPTDPKGSYFLGAAQIRAGSAAEGAASLEKALQGFEETGDEKYSAAARGLLGDAFVKAGQYDRAIAMYEKVIQEGGAGTDLASVYSNLGHVYVSKGDVDRGIEYFRKAQGSDPGNATSQYNLGVVFYNLGQKAASAQKAAFYKNAHEAFEKAFELNPRETDALYLAGETAAIMGKTAVAKARLERYLKDVPGGKYAADARELLADLK